ncbi:flagellar motor protein MotB, partial [Thauera propionica]|uniref:flagellar motor protein MotB n=1 Tax=Thauera propionica TaxID=2019431 RepID=UPI0023E3FEB7
MARRRKHEEEHENHERWLVSYADFITLLFAFFVVMYSLSSINEGKYRVLSDSIVQAFRSLNINESGQQIILPPVAVAPVVSGNRAAFLPTSSA